MSLTLKEITVALNSGEDISSNAQLQQALKDAEVELKKELEAKGVAEQLGDVAADSATLRRFLIARKLQLPETLQMLEAHATWRKATLPIALDEAVVTELKKGKCYLPPNAVDAGGRTLVVIRSSRFDPKVRDLDTALKAVIYQIDEAVRARPATQFAIFYDRNEFSIGKNLDRALVQGVVSTLSDNYPETLGAVYIYPSGAVANMVFKFAKNFMDPRTAAKVHMVTTDAMLATLIPLEFIPTTYGGSSTYEFDPSAYQVAT